MTSRVFSCCVLVLLLKLIYSAPPNEQKPLDCPENEYYEKCSLIVCQKACRDLFAPVACPGVSSDCFAPACLCKGGYFRNDEGVCVPSEKCEANCRENEEFTDCTYNVCRPQQCFEKGYVKDCKEVDKEYCRPGCVCKENHLMENGSCIPQDQCNTYKPSNEFRHNSGLRFATRFFNI